VSRAFAGRHRPEMDVEIRVGEDDRRTVKTSERISIDIVRDIVARGLHTGARLPLEASMAESYGVSRSTLREALRLLEVQGLIHLKTGPGGGPVVGTIEAAYLARTTSLYFHLSGTTYGQLMATQLLLEPMCAELAARHPDRQDVMRPFVTPNGPPDDDFQEVALDFHNAVYRLAQNPALTLLAGAVTRTVTQHVLAYMNPFEMHDEIAVEHTATARAISAGHPEKARTLMAAHFRSQHEWCEQHSPGRVADLVEWR
jgi:GntR family transcriptional repressor for pyruvate dehydrogenase complex